MTASKLRNMWIFLIFSQKIEGVSKLPLKSTSKFLHLTLRIHFRLTTNDARLLEFL